MNAHANFESVNLSVMSRFRVYTALVQAHEKEGDARRADMRRSAPWIAGTGAERIDPDLSCRVTPSNTQSTGRGVEKITVQYSGIFVGTRRADEKTAPPRREENGSHSERDFSLNVLQL